MTKKVFIRTFGCQMNEYDSDKMIDLLGSTEGVVRTDHVEEADIILFNTCSVREKPQEKVFHDLGRVRKLKEQKPDLIIGVGGCVASQEGAANFSNSCAPSSIRKPAASAASTSAPTSTNCSPSPKNTWRASRAASSVIWRCWSSGCSGMSMVESESRRW